MKRFTFALIFALLFSFSFSLGQNAYFVNDGEWALKYNYDSRAFLDSIQVGTYSVAIAAALDYSNVYVAQYDAGAISVINANTDLLTALIGVSYSPVTLTMHPGGNKFYVGYFSAASDSVDVVATPSNSVIRRISNRGNPASTVGFSPDGRKAYVSNELEEFWMVDAVADTVVDGHSYTANFSAITFLPNGTKAYCMWPQVGAIAVLDAYTDTQMKLIFVGGQFSRLAMSSDGKRIYVSDLYSSLISVIDTDLDTIIASIDLSGNNPNQLKLTPDDAALFVCCGAQNKVLIISTATNALIDSIPVDSVRDVAFTCTRTYGTRSVTKCNSFTAPTGAVYDSSGIYTYLIPNSNRCDSAITVNLTINHLDTSVSNNGFSLSSNEPGASYQWLDCSNGNIPIVGANGQSFVPPTAGSYSVIVTTITCADTSNCSSFVVGLGEYEKRNLVKIFPNPSAGSLTIQFLDGSQNGSYTLSTMAGMELVSGKLKTGITNLDLGDLPGGLYFLKVQSKNGIETFKVVKE